MMAASELDSQAFLWKCRCFFCPFFLVRPVICMAEQQPREQRGEEESWGQWQRTRAWRQRQVNLQALWAGTKAALTPTAVNQEITFYLPSFVERSCLLCTDSRKQPVKASANARCQFVMFNDVISNTCIDLTLFSSTRLRDWSNVQHWHAEYLIFQIYCAEVEQWVFILRI